MAVSMLSEVPLKSRFKGYAVFGSGESSVLLEVADTHIARQKGMMGRKKVPECCGMLFTGLTGGAFWMKGCVTDLDIVFIDDDKVTVGYTMKADDGDRLYRYGRETMAIEMAPGFCSRHGIEPGTTVDVRIWK